MKNPKAKGSAFERKVAAQLSLWITDGKRDDILWRSSISGGRATVALKKGVKHFAVGDICSVAQEGTRFCDTFFIECKHLRECDIGAALNGKGMLVKIWQKLHDQAFDHSKYPVLILKRNNQPTLWIATWNHRMADFHYRAVIHQFAPPIHIYFFEEDILKTPIPKALKTPRRYRQ